MRKNFIFVLLVLFVFVLPATAETERLPVFSDPSQPIILSSSQPAFMIQLPSNRTTGYSWFLTFYDAKYIKLTKHRYIAPNSTLLGAGGLEEWTFQRVNPALIAPNQLILQFIYVRPWEKKAAEKTRIFYVKNAL